MSGISKSRVPDLLGKKKAGKIFLVLQRQMIYQETIRLDLLLSRYTVLKK